MPHALDVRSVTRNVEGEDLTPPTFQDFVSTGEAFREDGHSVGLVAFDQHVLVGIKVPNRAGQTEDRRPALLAHRPDAFQDPDECFQRGLGWSELGLGRDHWRSGAWYAVGAVALVGSVIVAGALLPWTRPMFMNDHYATISGALLASMIIIPLRPWSFGST